LNTTKSDMHQ